MGLKEILKNSRNARKVFGKKEIGIIFRQLEGLPLTQSEKNRLSRDIRPKFELIGELSIFKDEFRLEKNQDNKKIIGRAVSALLNDKLKGNVQAILLFGSFADNSFTKRSDIDICAIFKKDLSLKEATKFRIRVMSKLPEKVDVQVFNVLPQKIKRSIMQSHKVLYKGADYDDVEFSIRYLKDGDYFARVERVFGAEA